MPGMGDPLSTGDIDDVRRLTLFEGERVLHEIKVSLLTSAATGIALNIDGTSQMRPMTRHESLDGRRSGLHSTRPVPL